MAMSPELTAPLPAALAHWPAAWQATGIFLFTFVLEDAATVGAGLLLAAGTLGWPAALLACGGGIWLGDAGLYALARWLGREWFERSSWRRHAHRVDASAAWFAARGEAILIISRIIPGARLPTFLAAGFLRMHLGRFLLITGLAALVWTVALLALTQAVGGRVLAWLGAWRHGGGWLLLLLPLLWGALHLLGRLGDPERRRRAGVTLRKWMQWEFWPAWLFYPPVVLGGMVLAVRYRGLRLPTCANPGIFSGGLVGESKMATLARLMATSAEFTAEAELIPGASLAEREAALAEILARRGITPPYILKPDQGQRGAGIKLIREPAQARAYLASFNAPVVVQRFAPGPGEAGVFYYRYPHEAKGRIFAITEKIFPRVVGDGKTTIRELVWRDPRARFVADKYLARLAGREETVPAAGEEIPLVLAGNHAQGCIFRDGARWITPELTARIDAISQGVPGFFIGRYDLRFEREDDLRAGRGFKIIELNGAAAEATSIYDARNSLWTAYGVLFRQWRLVYAIGAANRALGCRPTPAGELWRAWRGYGRLAATYPPAD